MQKCKISGEKPIPEIKPPHVSNYKKLADGMSDIHISRQDVAKVSSQTIRDALKQFGLSDISVSESIELSDGSEFDDSLCLGMAGVNENLAALLVSSEGASYCGKPIRMLLIPSTVEGSILHEQDSGSVATDFFYCIDGGTIKPIQTSKPVRLDLIDLFNDGEDVEDMIPSALIVNGPRLFEVTNSKLKTAQLYRGTEIRTPKSREITEDEIPNLPDIIEDFKNQSKCDGFVVKADTGAQGSYVRLFENGQCQSSASFIVELLAAGKQVFLEERVNPVLWRGEDGQKMDWNVRAIVSFGEDPRWIDSEVRFQPHSNEPVNISRSATAEELDKVAGMAGFSVESIKEFSINAAKILYERTGGGHCSGAGYLGLDLIIGSDGIYLIEANSGPVGGFSTLAKLRQGSLPSVKGLLESYGPKLIDNHAEHKDATDYKPLPNRSVDYCYLGGCLYQQEDYQSALMAYEKAVELDPSSWYFYVGVAYSSLKLERFDEAMGMFEQISKMVPQNRDGPCGIGDICYKMGRYGDAVESYKLAIRFKQKDFYAYYWMARAYLELGDIEQSMGSFSKCIEIKPDYEYAKYWLATILTKKGEHGKAIGLLREVLAGNPTAFPAYYALGRALADDGEPEESIKVIETALDLGPDANYTFSLKGLLAYNYERSYQTERAESVYLEMIGLDPTVHGVYARLAQLKHNKGSYEEAKDLAMKCLDLFPGNTAASIILIKAKIRERDLAEAETLSKDLLSRYPDDVSCLKSHAWLLINQQRYEEAEALLESILKDDEEKHKDVHGMLGFVYGALGKADKAISSFEKALDWMPGHFDYRRALGMLLYRNRQFREAIRHLRLALEIKAEDSDIKMSLGISLYHAMEYKGATEIFQEMAEQYQDNVSCHHWLGHALFKCGRHQDALKSFEKVVALEPDNPGYQGNLKRLRGFLESG